ncbi:hypothetical protein [Halarcobacter anaerophilus]|uniref:hypothetical protein n=1 Tax=Halarcobacter anaerophilus TaxID=877500 RepID=UPI0005CAF603|nr:hypothetical protein [Halarcobacter anaerophilus]
MSIFTYFKMKLGIKAIKEFVLFGIFMGLMIFFMPKIAPEFSKDTFEPIIEFILYPAWFIFNNFKTTDPLADFLILLFCGGVLFWIYLQVISYILYSVSAKLDRTNPGFLKTQVEYKEFKERQDLKERLSKMNVDDTEFLSTQQRYQELCKKR